MFAPGEFLVQMYAQVLYIFSCLLVRRMGGYVLFFRVKVIWTDFVSFAFTRHFFSHNWILFKCICSLCSAIAGCSCIVRTAVSSAKVAVMLSAVVCEPAV